MPSCLRRRRQVRRIRRLDGLTKLKLLNLSETQITDAGCAALASVTYSCALPALEKVVLSGTPVGGTARAAVQDVYHGARPHAACRIS